jgi:hypothetical protein
MAVRVRGQTTTKTAEELYEQARDVSRQASMLRASAAITRRFAAVEAETAAVLRKIAEDTADPETAARRRRLACQAEAQQAWALERADRLDRAGGNITERITER